MKNWIYFEDELPKDSKLVLVIGVGVDGKDKVRLGQLREWKDKTLLYVLGHSRAEAFSLDGTHDISYSPNKYTFWKYVDLDCVSCCSGWDDEDE